MRKRQSYIGLLESPTVIRAISAHDNNVTKILVKSYYSGLINWLCPGKYCRKTNKLSPQWIHGICILAENLIEDTACQADLVVLVFGLVDNFSHELL